LEGPTIWRPAGPKGRTSLPDENSICRFAAAGRQIVGPSNDHGKDDGDSRTA